MRKPDLFFECAGCVVESVGGEGAVANANGAGEAFLAALVAALLVDNDAAPRALEKACALRAYVASSESATPPHSAAPLELRDRFTRKRAEEEQPLAVAQYGGEAERRRAMEAALEAAERDCDW